jgi:hypothetical protein
MNHEIRELPEQGAAVTHSPGTDRETADAKPLCLPAGPLLMFFEPATAFLRRICWKETEVLRGIYAAIRDRNWGTVPPRINNLKSQIVAGTFVLTFDAECQQGEIHFRWHGEITGAADGMIEFTFTGEALSDFWRNRIGFCVLHPIHECAGARARQTRTDGSIVECRFPATIEPQIFGCSSFHDLRAVAHEIAPGLWAEVEFKGDVFEMEDQRNWTDASFKTYCTPLALPFPVKVLAGTQVRQSITLRLRGAKYDRGESRVEAAGPRPDQVTLTLPTASRLPMPRLGLGLASHGEPLTDGEIARLRSLPLAHLRVDVRLAAADWLPVWERAMREAIQLGVSLELALHLQRADNLDFSELQRRLRSSSVPIARVLALHEGEAATTLPTLHLARQVVAGLDVPVGSGSDANFCELNREQALGLCAVAEADFIFWAINPQVHATDFWSMAETLEAQADTVKSARTFVGHKPLVVSPITLKQRFNPVATGPEPAVPPGELPRQVDPRQRTLFGAAWTLGSLSALTMAGADSVTFYETTGWRGVMEKGSGAPLPEKFSSLLGEVFPVFQVFAASAGFDRATPAANDSRLAALALFKGDGRRLLLANLTSEPLDIKLEGCGSAVGVCLLDETNLQTARLQPEDFLTRTRNVVAAPLGTARLVLKAHALACLDLLITH